MINFAWAGRHVIQPVFRFVTWPLRQILRVAAWLSLGLVGWALVGHLRNGQQDPKLVAILVALGLLSAFVAQLGSDVILRIKKLGPFELFEEKAPDLLAALDDDKIGKLAQTQPKEVEVLTTEQRFAYEQADFFISLMELNRIDLSKDEGRRGRLYRELLWVVASAAYGLKDFPRALSRLELCRKLKFKGPAEALDYSEGLVHYSWSLALDTKKKEEREEREHHLERAFLCFSQTIRRRKDSHLAYSFLALTCSARGDYGLAIHYNGRALAIRPQFAMARYNRACNLVRLGRLKRALTSLKRIESQDEEIEKVRGGLSNDPDLANLRNHPLYGDELRQIYLGLGGKQESWRPPEDGGPGQS